MVGTREIVKWLIFNEVPLSINKIYLLCLSPISHLILKGFCVFSNIDNVPFAHRLIHDIFIISRALYMFCDVDLCMESSFYKIKITQLPCF